MTDHQSIATVTAILSQAAQGFAANAVEGATATTQRPDGLPATGVDAVANRVNLFMFQVNFDSTFRNGDLPTRDRSGQLVQRPRAALQLHYLLSFYGDESVLAPQRMLAAVIAGLHARPWISMDRAAAFIAQSQGEGDLFHYLADSRLAEQGESVRLTPDSLNLEELSKLWSVFFQVPYALSIAYKASVVLVDAQETPRSVLPVRTPSIEVNANHSPIVVSAVRAQQGPKTPIFATTTLAITGSGFVGGGLVVRIDGASNDVVAESPTALSFDLTGRGLRAGSHVLQVARRSGTGSNPFGFALVPRVTQAAEVAGASTRTVRVDVDVEVGAAQRVEVLLDEVGGAGTRFTLPVPRRTGDGSELEVVGADVPNGTFLVRVRIDGAESGLDSAGAPADWAYTGPTLELS